MNDLTILFCVASALWGGLVWVIPVRYSQAFGVAVTVGLIAWLSLPTLLWMGSLTIVTAILTGFATAGFAAPLAAVAYGALLLVLREVEGPVWIGAAYFTLRNIHVLLEAWQTPAAPVSLSRLITYNFFPPVIIAGPIHRLANFERQWQRRRFAVQDFASGAERVLFGAAQAVILGAWAMGELRRDLRSVLSQAEPFMREWMISALGWMTLYFIFAGLSSVAVGAARMGGVRIEENFDRPYLAWNLVDFWNRWHITLSRWCRDYVYRPVSAWTRSPIIGVGCAMLVIGLWHESSVYYVLWALWQTVGVVLSHLIVRRIETPPVWLRLVGPVVVLAWLTLARPVLAALIGEFA